MPLELNAAVFWLELVRADLSSTQNHFCHWCCREDKYRAAIASAGDWKRAEGNWSMTVKKLTAADRTEILDLYRNTGETTSTLADRYGVSNSTISRFLKVTLPEDEYEILIAAKRAARTPGGGEKEAVAASPKVEAPVVEAPVVEVPVVEAPILKQAQPDPFVETPTPKPIRKRRSTAKIQSEVEPLAEQLELLNNPSIPIEEEAREEVRAEANEIAAIMVGEELLDEDDEDDEDDDLDDLEDLDEDDDFEEDTTPAIARRLPVESFVRVLPLSEAMLPRTCYIVIDRMAELITRPLRDFADLGQIPVQEVQQKTLPIFDNHRVARRFSSKRDRVIKVPDSRMLQKTRSQLQSKGITRLLFDGRVYSLVV